MTLISVAGGVRRGAAHQALSSEKNVMLFSDNVTLEDEIALKPALSATKGCWSWGRTGTAMIAGTPLAFANVTPSNIGVIGASGTGIQELVSQIVLGGEGSAMRSVSVGGPI